MATLLAVSKAADAVGAHLSQHAVEAVELLFRVAEVRKSSLR